jgi:hypothetical protein
MLARQMPSALAMAVALRPRAFKRQKIVEEEESRNEPCTMSKLENAICEACNMAFMLAPRSRTAMIRTKSAKRSRSAFTRFMTWGEKQKKSTGSYTRRSAESKSSGRKSSQLMAIGFRERSSALTESLPSAPPPLQWRSGKPAPHVADFEPTLWTIFGPCRHDIDAGA